MLPRQLHRALALVLVAGVASGCAAAVSGDVAEPSMATTGPNEAAERIPVTVARPSGTGPFPAVVILHDCSGLGPRSSHAPARWAREFTGRGYVVIMPDSFGTRGFPNGVCTDPSPTRADVSPSRRQWDAYAALAHARALPEIDGRRVGLMGGSHGGSTTVNTVAAPVSAADPLVSAKRAGFAAAVALFPACGFRLGARNGATGNRHLASPPGPAAR